MMSIPYLVGFTPTRWEKAIGCMLEKDQGDTNGTLNVIWNRRLVPVAEGQNMISPVQFANRKGRTSLDALLLKI
eukprot:4912316-Ditylum_brightwellii.AAC.1